MSHPSKAKGSAFERDVLREVRGVWPDAERIPPGAHDDRGDIVGVPDLTIECKNHRSVADGLRLGVDQAANEMRNNGDLFGVAVVKRPRLPVKDAYAVMPLRSFLTLYGLYRLHLEGACDE